MVTPRLFGFLHRSRRGEILAVWYSDIDWLAGEIVVSSAVKKVKADDGVHKWRWELGPTKGNRTRGVGIGEKTLRFLAELRQTAIEKEGFIFTPQAAGLAANQQAVIDPDYFDEFIYGPAAAARLSGVRFHDLRHFSASMLIAQGETAKYVCDEMGHSSIKVTFDTYGDLFPQAEKGGVLQAGGRDVCQAQETIGRNAGRKYIEAEARQT